MHHNMRYCIIHQTIVIISNHHCVVQAGDVAAAGVGGEERRSSRIQQVSSHFMDCHCVKFPNHLWLAVSQVGDVAAASVGGGAAAPAGGGERPGPAAAPHVPPLLQLERAAGCFLFCYVIAENVVIGYSYYIYIYIYIAIMRATTTNNNYNNNFKSNT